MTFRAMVLGFLLTFAQGASGPHGILITNIQLIDGTGSPARRADVRIDGDTITTVAAHVTPRPGERIIDGRGQILAPGFIDMHSHADRGLDDMPNAETQVRQGVTTA